jgi:DNA polymerase elongation subunit (family B)
LHFARDEFDLYKIFVEIFREHDPDIVLGWETEIMSIGYLIKRA